MYLVLPYTDFQRSSEVLLMEDLEENIQAAYLTVACLIGQNEPDQFDSALAFNTALWARYNMAVASYLTVMMDELERRCGYLMLREATIRNEMRHLIPALSGESGQILGMPPWTQREECLCAMRGFLSYKNPVYQENWPDIPPLLFPVPQGIQAYA